MAFEPSGQHGLSWEALLCALVEAAGQEEALKGRAARQMQLWKRAA